MLSLRREFDDKLGGWTVHVQHDAFGGFGGSRLPEKQANAILAFVRDADYARFGEWDEDSWNQLPRDAGRAAFRRLV